MADIVEAHIKRYVDDTGRLAVAAKRDLPCRLIQPCVDDELARADPVGQEGPLQLAHADPDPVGNGTAVAVQGRCPHRHFPLGASRRVGDAIQCAYHGITFDAAGACTFVPSQDKIPGVYAIKAYPLVERGLWAWIWPGDPALADESLIPDMSDIGYDLPGFHARALFYHHVAGRYQLLNDNLLDLSHLGYLHHSSIGTSDDAATPEEREANDRVIRSRRIMRNTLRPAVVDWQTDFDGPIDRVSGMDFHIPGFHAGIADVMVAQGHARAGELLRSNRVWHAVTPAGRTTTNYFFAMASRDPKALDEAESYLKPVIEEDIFATVEIEKIISTMDELPQELMLKSDGTAVLGRRALQRMMDAEARKTG